MLTRRRLVNLLLGGGILGSLASIAYPVFKFMIPPDENGLDPELMNLGPTEKFPPGSSKIFKFGGSPVILVRSTRGTFHALAATCTHLDCLVQYRADMESIWCACHNGRYDLSGGTISGPPPKPLDRFVVRKIRGEVIVVKRV